MRQVIKALLVVAVTIVAMFVFTGALMTIGRPCRPDAMFKVMICGFSIPPAVTLFVFRYQRSRQFWASLGRACVLWLLTAFIAAVALQDAFGTHERARQRYAMAEIRSLATAYEGKRQAGKLAPSFEYGPLDPWGHPYLVITTTQRYAIVSCSECGGAFDRSDPLSYPRGATTSFNSDIVFSDGVFIAYPEGAQQ